MLEGVETLSKITVKHALNLLGEFCLEKLLSLSLSLFSRNFSIILLLIILSIDLDLNGKSEISLLNFKED